MSARRITQRNWLPVVCLLQYRERWCCASSTRWQKMNWQAKNNTNFHSILIWQVRRQGCNYIWGQGGEKKMIITRKRLTPFPKMILVLVFVLKRNINRKEWQDFQKSPNSWWVYSIKCKCISEHEGKEHYKQIGSFSHLEVDHFI